MSPSNSVQAARGLPIWSVLACLPLILLTGCPGDPTTTTAAPGKTPTQATAPALTAGARQNNGPASPPPVANAYKVQQLITNAERSYRSGVTNYQQGRLEAARQDFDFAVDILLTSGLDVRNEPALSDEFDRLLNAVNSLELSALKQGNGFSAPIEPSPIESAADLTFPPNPELTAKLKSELTTASDLPLIINDQVAGYINYFANSPSFHAHMLRSLERAGKYRALIERILGEEGVPKDMIYLAVAESGFQPQAMNGGGSGAGGMWQFMPTGAYGLARNGWVDERFDPEKSSRAYARYIKSLHAQFGDWYLAMAAYDWGPGNIQKAVMRTGYADYWELYRRNAMPAETRNYVPQILAAIIMAKNPEKYGLDKVHPDAPVLWDSVTTDYPADLRLVADITGASVSTIVALNPSLLRLSTPRDLTFDLHIPVGTRDLFVDRIKDIPEDKRASWRFHVVKTGETLESIASDMHGRATEIALANDVPPGAPLSAGDELIIPIASASSSLHPVRYTTRTGDTLVTIADRFNVSADDLRRWNHLSSSTVRPGKSLNVAEPVHLGSSSRRGRHGSNPRGSRTSASSARSSRSSGATSTRSAHTTTSHAPGRTPRKSHR